MAELYVQYREGAGGATKWMVVHAESKDAARAEVEAQGHAVLRVANRGEAFPAGYDAPRATAHERHPEPVRAARPVRTLVTELEARQLFWMIVVGVVLAMAIWWLISLALGWFLVAVLRVGTG
jgi:hypothetical protein